MLSQAALLPVQLRIQNQVSQTILSDEVLSSISVRIFTLYREFATTFFLKCNRVFQVHCLGVEAERRDAFLLKSEISQKKYIIIR